MIKTKIKKTIALSCVVGLTASSLFTSGLGTAFAATQIGTGSVTATGVFDTAIIWDDAFPGTASGSISGVKVKARVLPTLTMEISTGTIDLGTLVSGVASTGSLFIEVGTNAKAGVTITARSWSGGLTNTSDSSIKISNNGDAGFFDDSINELYSYESTPNIANDSSSPTFTSSGLLITQINNNTLEHTVYTTNKWESTTGIDDVEFIVSATSVAETTAWDYEDTITFTVTGNF